MNVETAKPAGGFLDSLTFLFWNGLLASLLGTIAVVSVFPLNFAALGIWLFVLVSRTGEQLRKRGSSHAANALLIQAIVMATIVTVAHVAPGKTTERFLDRTVTLSKSRLTLAELESEQWLGPERRPFWLQLSVPENEKTTLIVFPETSITLRQFVHAVENQSPLRHRFGHCGNGWTILWGGDCSFGLSLQRPPSSSY